SPAARPVDPRLSGNTRRSRPSRGTNAGGSAGSVPGLWLRPYFLIRKVVQRRQWLRIVSGGEPSESVVPGAGFGGGAEGHADGGGQAGRGEVAQVGAVAGEFAYRAVAAIRDVEVAVFVEDQPDGYVQPAAGEVAHVDAGGREFANRVATAVGDIQVALSVEGKHRGCQESGAGEGAEVFSGAGEFPNRVIAKVGDIQIA